MEQLSAAFRHLLAPAAEEIRQAHIAGGAFIAR